jgi:hypothetical protein
MSEGSQNVTGVINDLSAGTDILVRGVKRSIIVRRVNNIVRWVNNIPGLQRQGQDHSL